MSIISSIQLINRRMRFQIAMLSLRLQGQKVSFGKKGEMESGAKIIVEGPKECSLSFGNMVYIGQNTRIVLRDGARIEMGNKVHVSEFSKIDLRKESVVKLGDEAYFNKNFTLLAAGEILIGEHLNTGPNVVVCDHDHKHIRFENDDMPKNAADRIGKVMIKKYAWLAANTIVLRDSIVGMNSIMAAGTVLKGALPDNKLYCGKDKIRDLV